MPERSFPFLVQHDKIVVYGKSRQKLYFMKMIGTLSPTIQKRMQNFGYRVIAKTDGRSALSVSDEEAVVYLVIMDYMMHV